MIACNPYHWITGLYSNERRLLYSKTLVWDPAGKFVTKDDCANDDKSHEHTDDKLNGGAVSSPQDHLEPHVYEQSALAYRGLAMDGLHQSILVTGESGAGKTETVKICMNHIASVSSGPPPAGATEKHVDPAKQEVIQRILDSNPLLEAFGNAKTRRNDNSSRFGKYIQLQFKGSDEPLEPTLTMVPECSLVGSYCDTYLLEKNRVIHHDTDERTFHIFYQILASSDAVKSAFWGELRNKSPSSYKYVGKTDTNVIEGITDEQKFEHVLASLKFVGVEGDKLTHLIRGICMVMQLGNISFEDDEQGNDGCVISNKRDVETLADIMGTTEVDELEMALTHRTVTARKQSTKVPLRPDTAKEFCDAFAKHLYSSLFDWLVKAINDATCGTNFHHDLHGTKVEKNDFGIISLLDIFGFEFFETNSFEQLCINYANEMLQHKFTKDVFDSVFEEYKSQGIPLDRVTYDDNQDVLDLIQTNRTGLLSILNEECILPQGSDLAFCRKVIQANQGNKADVLYVGIKFEDYEFGIRHYAADVVYDSRNFLTKNQDTVPNDLVKCVGTKSSNPVVKGELEKTIAEQNATTGRGKRMSSALVAKTVWTNYKSQLKALMVNLGQTQTRYIRCIKPNAQKKPLLMEHGLTLEQLRSAGVVAAITMAQAAFPNRMENPTVFARFGPLLRLVLFLRKGKKPPAPSTKFSENEKCRENVQNLLEVGLKSQEVTQDGKAVKAFAVGRTRTYFVAGALEYLEALRYEAIDKSTISIQKCARGYVVRKSINLTYIRKRIVSRLKLQMWARMVAAKLILDGKKREVKMKGARVHLQGFCRIVAAKTIAREKRREKLKDTSIVKLQCWARVMLAKKTAHKLTSRAEKLRRKKKKQQKILKMHNKMATRIQARMRGVLKRKHYEREKRMFQATNEIDDEIEAMKEELAFLKDTNDKLVKELPKELKKKEEEIKKQIEESLNQSMNGFRETMIEGDDRVISLRAENKTLRAANRKMEAEAQRTRANIVIMEKSNAEAADAVSEARNAYLRLVVKNQKLVAIVEAEEDDAEHKIALMNTRNKQYEVEKMNREKYLKTVNKAIKLIKKNVPGTNIAKDAVKIAKKYIQLESDRRKPLNKPNPILQFEPEESSENGGNEEE